MIEGLKRQCAGHSRIRLLVVGAATIASAVVVAACGDSSDDASKANASTTTPAAQTQAAPTQVAPAQTQTAATPGVDPTKAPPDAYHKSMTAKGLVRVGVLRLGYQGKVTVSPKGETPKQATYHWYKPGTELTIRATDTDVAYFTEWGGLCTGKQRVCKVKADRSGLNAVAGFELKPSAAKKYKKDDPRLQVVISD